MSASLNSFSALWSRFVTADGASYTAGRVALALVISVLLFPFGLAIVVALWAFLSPMPLVLPDMKTPGFTSPATLPSLGRLFAWSFILPTALGSIPLLLSAESSLQLANSAIALAEFSFIHTSLEEWLRFYEHDGVRRGVQYVITALAIGYALPLLYAHYARHLLALPVKFAGSLMSGVISKTTLFWYVLISVLAWAGPNLFFIMSPQVSHDLGIVGPGTQLTFFHFPVVVVPALGELVCCIALGALLSGIRAVVSPNWRIEGWNS